MLELDRQAKRIEMLEETVRRKQYELDQVRDRLDRREKDIETLKAEIMKYTKAMLNLADYVLPQAYREETLKILGYEEAKE